MDLQQFIAETLRQIIAGVEDAQGFAKEHGATVNPKGARRSGDNIGTVPPYSPIIQEVGFDVAVTAAEGSGATGGAGLFVGPFAIGAKAQSGSTNEIANRVRFSIVIQLPAQ